jgi:hypothetical protein
MQNKIEDLRNHLFACLEALSDPEKPMELDRAKAIADVAQVIINSAKVEVDFINKVGGVGTNFIPQETRPKYERITDTTPNNKVA